MELWLIMFIPIKIDLTEITEEFNLDGSQIKLLGNELINSISDKYFSAIKQKVNTTLKATRGIYLKNLKIETIDDLTKEIILSGWLPNALESGQDIFDMKPGFSGAKNVKISAKGNWYTTIPFNWSKSGGETGQKIPNDVYNIVSKQSSPLRESQLPESRRIHQVKDLAKGINATKLGVSGIYQHKNSIYTGMQKQNSDYGNGYISFRRVGAVSDPNSFWHPGLVKRDFFGKALNDIQDEIPILADKIIDEFLVNQGFQ